MKKILLLLISLFLMSGVCYGEQGVKSIVPCRNCGRAFYTMNATSRGCNICKERGTHEMEGKRDENYHWMECKDCGWIDGEKEEHGWEYLKEEETETKHVKKCTICHKLVKEDHQYTTDSEKHYYCTVCGGGTEGEHSPWPRWRRPTYQECTICRRPLKTSEGDINIGAVIVTGDHIFAQSDVEQIGEDGYTHNECYAGETGEISWGMNNTFHYALCKVCKKQITNTTEKHADDDKNGYCDACGFQMSVVDKATVTDGCKYKHEAGRKICDTEYTPLKGMKHRTEWKCKGCGTKLDEENVPCNFWITRDGEDDRLYCACGNSKLPETSGTSSEGSSTHTCIGAYTGGTYAGWFADGSTHWVYCKTCGGTKTQMQGIGLTTKGTVNHYDKNSDGVCDACGYKTSSSSTVTSPSPSPSASPTTTSGTYKITCVTSCKTHGSSCTGGTLSASPNPVTKGQNVTLTATPKNSNHKLVSIGGSGWSSTTCANTGTLTTSGGVSSDMTYYAVFYDPSENTDSKVVSAGGGGVVIPGVTETPATAVTTNPCTNCGGDGRIMTGCSGATVTKRMDATCYVCGQTQSQAIRYNICTCGGLISSPTTWTCSNCNATNDGDKTTPRGHICPTCSGTGNYNANGVSTTVAGDSCRYCNGAGKVQCAGGTSTRFGMAVQCSKCQTKKYNAQTVDKCPYCGIVLWYDHQDGTGGETWTCSCGTVNNYPQYTIVSAYDHGIRTCPECGGTGKVN